MIFETHAHYDDEAFDEDRETLLASMQQNMIGCLVNVGASLESTQTRQFRRNGLCASLNLQKRSKSQ